MRLGHVRLLFGCWSLVLLLTLCVGIQGAWSGSLRISMIDGTSLEVPYYWEEDGQLKFETPGGVAGIPKNQVAKVQEVLATREFDPEALIGQPEEVSNGNGQKALEDLALNKTPLNPSFTRLDPQESARLLNMASESRRESVASKDKLFGPALDLKGDFAELVRSEGNGVLLVIRNIISSRQDLGGKAFDIILYDAEGSVLQRKPCELHELDIDHATMKRLNLSGRIFSVSASVAPDPKIKRYEITAAKR